MYSPSSVCFFSIRCFIWLFWWKHCGCDVRACCIVSLAGVLGASSMLLVVHVKLSNSRSASDGQHPLFLTLLLCHVSPAAHIVISEEKGQCFRVLGSGQGPSSCSLPILRNITKQICCCSRVGKAWGADCQRCPYFGSGWPTVHHIPF